MSDSQADGFGSLLTEYIPETLSGQIGRADRGLLGNLVEAGHAPKQWGYSHSSTTTYRREANQALAQRIYIELCTAPEWEHLSFPELAKRAKEAAEAFEGPMPNGPPPRPRP